MRPRTLLAALVLAGDRGMSQREIRTALWGSAPPATVRAQVHTYVSRLRRALGGRAGLARAHDGYVLRLDGVTVDYRECLRLAAGARTACAEGRYDESSVLFAGALRQWQGPALAGATEFLDQQEGTRLEELRLSLLEEKADVDLGLGRGREVVDAFSPLAEKHPFRERMRAQLMTALYQCGRQADAIAVYQRGRAVLAEHLGVNPGETLESTFHALLAGNLSAARADVLPPAGPAVVTRVNSLGSRAELPSDLIDFAGRGAELAVLRRLLSGDRTGDRPGPVVITGVAGSGKSALAVRAAHRGEAAFPDGRFFLRFRDASGQSRPLQTVLDGLLEALGGEAPTGRQGQGPEDRLRLVRQRLAQGRRLIVLDGVGAEDPVDALVSVCGPNQVVITGRPRFAHLPGVRVLVLDALPHSEAVALLTGITDRATDGDPAAVERLVHLCERHPGALRAVAAQLTARPHWTPGRLADRLADPRRNMLDLLRIGGLDVGGSLRRHYAELPEALRRALRRLAMLRAHTISVWSAAAALDLPHEETEDVLERLVDAHMLTVTGVEQDGTFVLGLSRLLLCVLTGEVERTDPGQVPAEVAARVLASWRQRLADAGPLAPPEPAGAGTHPDGRFTGVLRSWPAGPFSGSAGLCRACVRELRATRTALRV